MAEGLDPLVQSALEDPRVMLVPPDLRVLRAMRGNADLPDLPDQKALEVFRVLLDLLAVELEEPLYLAPKDLGVPLALLDLKVTMVFRALPALLVPPGQMVNPDPRAIMVQLDPLALLDLRALPDQLAQQANVVLPDRMQSLLSSISTSLRLRQLRLMVRRQMSRMLFVRPTRLRTALGTTRQ